MKQDRKLNKMIMFASVLGVLAGIIVLVAGAGTAVFGFLKHEELAKIKDLAFFINQEGLNSLQKVLLGGLLKIDYLYLALGGFVGVIGLLVLIFSILGINYAKKHKVVRRRGAILIFNLIPLAIASCVAVYLVLEFNTIPDMIKYIGYGLGGVFGVIGLFNLLGIICSRSEKFMSNDNGKLAFDNSSLRDARAEVNSNVKDAEYQPINQGLGAGNEFVYQEQNQGSAPVYQPMGQPTAQVQQPRPQQTRPMPPRPQQGPMPTNSQMARPAGVRPQMNPGAQSTARPVAPQTRPVGQQARPMPPRPQQGQMPARPTGARPQGAPAQAGAQRPTTAQHKYCLGCGSMLNPGEMFCKVCGTKVNK